MKKMIVFTTVCYLILLILMVFISPIWVILIVSPLMIIDVAGSVYLYKKYKKLFSGDWPRK